MIIFILKGFPEPTLKISPLVFSFLKILNIKFVKSETYKKSLFCLPCDVLKLKSFKHPLIIIGINLFISWYGPYIK